MIYRASGFSSLVAIALKRITEACVPWYKVTGKLVSKWGGGVIVQYWSSSLAALLGQDLAPNISGWSSRDECSSSAFPSRCVRPRGSAMFLNRRHDTSSNEFRERFYCMKASLKSFSILYYIYSEPFVVFNAIRQRFLIHFCGVYLWQRFFFFSTNDVFFSHKSSQQHFQPLNYLKLSIYFSSRHFTEIDFSFIINRTFESFVHYVRLYLMQ